MGSGRAPGCQLLNVRFILTPFFLPVIPLVVEVELQVGLGPFRRVALELIIRTTSTWRKRPSTLATHRKNFLNDKPTLGDKRS